MVFRKCCTLRIVLLVQEFGNFTLAREQQQQNAQLEKERIAMKTEKERQERQDAELKMERKMKRREMQEHRDSLNELALEEIDDPEKIMELMKMKHEEKMKWLESHYESDETMKQNRDRLYERAIQKLGSAEEKKNLKLVQMLSEERKKEAMKKEKKEAMKQ